MIGERMTNLKPSTQPIRWLAVLLAFGTLGLVASGITALFVPCARLISRPIDDWLTQFILLAWAIFAIVGWLIVFYRPRNRIGWLCLTIGLVGAAQFAVDYSMICVAEEAVLPQQFVFHAWLYYAVLSYGLVVTLFVLLPMLFPNGRFLSPRWRNTCWSLLTIATIAQIIAALTPDLHQPNFAGITVAAENPFAAVPATWAAAANNMLNFAIIVAALFAIASMVVRFRRATGDERQQLKWLAYFLGTAVAIQLIVFELIGFRYVDNNPEVVETAVYDLFLTAYGLILNIVFIGFPLIIGLTVFKYRLYNIDIIIRRTVQYGVVSAVLAAVYFGTITVIQGGFTAVTNTQSPLAIVLSTLLIAALFNPLRRRVQTAVDRRFYRQKYDAQQVLAQFAQVARDETEMEALTAELVRVVQETMQPEKISLWIKK
jgi:hypothetical protein